MANNTDLQFLQDKISGLKSALLFSEQASVLKMFNTVVEVVKVDDMGQLWFFVPKPRQALGEFDKVFPVRMEFFRKGIEFYLHITGRAYIITDPEEINTLLYEQVLQQVPEKKVLMKVKLLKADYYESGAVGNAHRLHDLWEELMAWMFNTRKGYRPYFLYNAESSLPAA